MVESSHGYSMVDEVINDVDPATGGAYTAIGTYEHTELVALVASYASKSGQDILEVLRLFGHHLFQAFVNNHPAFFKPEFDTFQFLSSVDTYIHIEVAKLYPDAHLPEFETSILDSSTMEMIYHSDRRMAPLALGLIEKTLEFYKEEATIELENLELDGTRVKFTISKG